MADVVDALESLCAVLGSVELSLPLDSADDAASDARRTHTNLSREFAARIARHETLGETLARIQGEVAEIEAKLADARARRAGIELDLGRASRSPSPAPSDRTTSPSPLSMVDFQLPTFFTS